MTRHEILERLCLLHYKVTFNLDLGEAVCFCNNNPQEEGFDKRVVEFIEEAVKERLQKVKNVPKGGEKV